MQVKDSGILDMAEETGVLCIVIDVDVQCVAVAFEHATVGLVGSMAGNFRNGDVGFERCIHARSPLGRFHLFTEGCPVVGRADGHIPLPLSGQRRLGSVNHQFYLVVDA